MTTLHAALADRLVTVGGVDAAGGADATAGDRTERLAGRRLECVAADGERLLVGTFDGGLLASTDGGQSFERVEGIAQDAVTSVALDPHDPGRVWAGTEPSRVYRSDGGESFGHVGGLAELPSSEEWSFPPRPDTHHVRWLEPDPTDPERLYVGVEAGAFIYTDDGGETWHERPPGSRVDNHTLATHPDAPGRVYSAAGDGYAESADGGESWTVATDGLDRTYVWGLAVDPGDPDTVVVSAATGARQAHRVGGARVYRSSAPAAGERVWEQVAFPSGEDALRAVLTRGRSAGELYAADDHGLHASTDSGATWATLVDWGEAFGGTAVRGLAVA
jgi:photosystem II stability/assembly factor-like uncharacterized protein